MLVLLLCLPLRVHADAAGAKVHFQKATAHFAVGQFAEAAEEYQAAYMAKQDPALLYNAAQAFRLAGQNDKALILYRNYVQLYPDEKNVPDVKAQIAKLKDVITVQEKAKTWPPTEPVAPQPMTGPDATPESKPAPRAEATVAAEPPRKKPAYKQWWLWTVVGVAVAGIVVGVAVGTTQSSPSWSNLPDFGPGSR